MHSGAELPFPGRDLDTELEGGAMEERPSKRRRIRRRRYSPSPARGRSQRTAEPAPRIPQRPADAMPEGGACKGRSHPSRPPTKATSSRQRAMLRAAQSPGQCLTGSADASGPAVSPPETAGAAGLNIPVLLTSQQHVLPDVPSNVTGGENLPLQMISHLSAYLSKILSELHTNTSVSNNIPVAVPPSFPKDNTVFNEPAAVVWSADNISQSANLCTSDANTCTGKSATNSSGAVRLPGAHLKESMPCVLSPLGFHLPITVKDKIWNGEFIDILSLLPSSKEQNFKFDKDDKIEEDSRKNVPK